MINAPDKTGFDRIFFSVGSPVQNRIFEQILPHSEEKYGKVFSVIPDSENGGRIGSGGALLKTLQCIDAKKEKKTLLILTGGHSKRAPNYALPGKALVPVGHDEAPCTVAVLDAVLDNALCLSGKIGTGIVVCCVDIVVDLSAFTDLLDASCAFCVFSDIKTGTRHGVMFPGAAGLLCDYPQKASADRLCGFAAAYGYFDEIPVDAGWVYLSASYLNALNRVREALLDMLGTDGKELSLFTDILPVNAVNTDREEFLQSKNGDLRALLWDALREEPLYVHCLRQPFLHFGTPAEILRNSLFLSGKNRTRFYNCDISPSAAVGNGCLMENVQLTGACQVGDDCLITDVDLRDITVPAQTSVFGLRLKDGRFVCCVQPIEQDPSVAGEELLKNWSEPIYYPASSFSASYAQFLQGDPRAQRVSLESALADADEQYYLNWRQYLADTRRCSTPVSDYYVYRKKVIETHFQMWEPCKSIHCIKERVTVELPVRINFSGTWTDCMPYCIENGGEVINAAVKVNGRCPIRVTAERIPEKRIEMCNADTASAAEFFRAEEHAPALSDCNLHRAVLRTLGITAETEVAQGFRLTVSVSGIMKGSGLGTSSILLFGCFRALSELLGMDMQDETVLSCVFVAEQLMQTGGGWQDQGAVIGGGLKSVRSAPGLPQKTKVERLPCSEVFLKKLSNRLVLVSTGQRHFGRFIVTDVMNRYLTREPETLCAFEALAALNARIREAINREDLGAFGACMNLHAKNLDLLSPLVYNNIIRKVSEDCMQFADGCCICGAGGGGYLAVLLKEGVSAETLRVALQTEVLPIEIL